MNSRRMKSRPCWRTSLGHQVHRDILFLIAFGTIEHAGRFLPGLAGDELGSGALRLRRHQRRRRVSALWDSSSGIYGLVTSPIDNAVSRWRERMADEYALGATGKNEAFASAFVRLANQNLGEVDPEKWVVFMFYSHPPLAERIEMARNWRTAISLRSLCWRAEGCARNRAALRNRAIHRIALFPPHAASARGSGLG